jgi:membrane associated rhomboid family serine protease
MNLRGGHADHAAHQLRLIFAAPATLTWLLVLLVVQTVLWIAGGAEMAPLWFEALALSREGIVLGRWWQPITHALVHGSWPHLLANGVFLVLAGSRIEHIAGAAAVTRTIAAGMIAGGAAHLLFGVGMLVGASGGCFALLLLHTTLSPQSRFWPIPVSARHLGAGLLTAALVLALANPQLALPGMSALGRWIVGHGMEAWFRLGHACHLGGGLAGWVAGRWMLRPRVNLATLQRERARREKRNRR